MAIPNTLGPVTIVREPSDEVAHAAPVNWAISQLQAVLSEKGIVATLSSGRSEPAAPARSILVASRSCAANVLAGTGVILPNAPESLVVTELPNQDWPTTIAAGYDVRGLVYAVLELTDRVACAEDPLAALRIERPLVERPANPIRSIARLFSSDVEDKAWFYDRDFWRAYLSELATHRYNRFNLTLGLGYNFPRRVSDVYLYFSYPFLLDVPGFSVRARGLADSERDRNLEMVQFIGDEVKARGLHFQLALWTHAYEWIDSPEANYLIDGLSSDNHAAYCRAAVRLLLQKVPTVDGVTFRVHGESGIPEGSYDFWREVFTGVKECGRSVEIDMHAKGIDQRTIDLARETKLPTVVSPKYWAEHQGLPYHQAGIRELEQVRESGNWEQSYMALSAGSRRFTRYGYADLLPEDRTWGILYRIWPGTQRLLLWGDPAMAAGYGRFSHFAGCDGVELCEPLSFKGRMGSGLTGSRDGYADQTLAAAGPSADWQKYRYLYRVWGRLLYNPEHDPDGWQRFSREQFGAAAPFMDSALANASRILLLITTAYHPSASNNRYWPEVYTNMPMAWPDGETRPHPYSDTPTPRRFGTVSPLDPELFSSVEDFVDEVITSEHTGRYSPLDVAGWLQRFADTALASLNDGQRRASNPNAPEFRRWAADVEIQSGLGHFFAQKLRAGVAYTLFKRTGQMSELSTAIDHYRRAREAWAAAAEAGKVYRSDLTFGREPWLRGHWADRLPAIDLDIADLEAELAQASAKPIATATAGPSLSGLLTAPSPVRPVIAHVPPASFRPGEPVPVELSLVGDASGISIALRYRHVNQAESYRSTGMEPVVAAEGPARYRASIPNEYTDSPFALEYFFVLRSKGGDAWLAPGFEPDLANQPYYVVRQAGKEGMPPV
ncbi:MAG TPA: hypothetical protein VMW65_15525 [Chloroflexota bacterium]|nr:hypothetical protein [Chloroflexota bacterium]